jgi:hypothetical protein
MFTIKYLNGLLMMLAISGLACSNMHKPDLNRIEEQTKKLYNKSDVAYRNNYEELVNSDKNKNNTFLTEEAIYAKVYENSFPYSIKKLDKDPTKRIIEILNDTSSYEWGEFGTPEYDKVIIYYGKTADPIGYTLVDPSGEVENYPYRSLMKWGMLTNKGFSKLSNELYQY